MSESEVRSLSGGANQRGLRDHNERLLLSLMQRHGPLPGSDLAKLAGLSAQTVSVILRRLETDGMIRRGEPQRGKVGKPSIPMGLDPDGVLSIGLKIGRRSADLVLVDFEGHILRQLQTTYRYPVSDEVMEFLRNGLEILKRGIPQKLWDRVAGIGIARPQELWTWHDTIKAPPQALASWKALDIEAEIAAFCPLPVFVENDATAACRAEHVYGRGRAFRDFAYIFVGSFIGGGIVLNHSVFEGPMGNAGALGSLPARRADGSMGQLIDTASLHLLETALVDAGRDPSRLWTQPQDWSAFEPILGDWLENEARELARATATLCAVIDFEAVLIDGGFPSAVREDLVLRTRAAMARIDMRGLIIPRVEAGLIGGNARALGAACGPVFSQFFLNTHAGLSVG